MSLLKLHYISDKPVLVNTNRISHIDEVLDKNWGQVSVIKFPDTTDTIMVKETLDEIYKEANNNDDDIS